MNGQNMSQAEKSLGLVAVPEGTIEHDLALLAKFQELSAELLRIALIGISAIGFVLSRVIFPEKDAPEIIILPLQKYLLMGALIALAISAATALAHRFYSADSLSWHLQAIRRYTRNLGSDCDKANAESHARSRKFKKSTRAVAWSAAALGTGTVLLACSIITAI